MIVGAHPAVAASIDLDLLAQRLATLAADAIDDLVAREVAGAVHDHRIDDAIRWQRARVRAHRLRARATGACRA